jgi:hypothetical protein
MSSPNSKRVKLEVSNKYVFEIYKNPVNQVGGGINITMIEGTIKLQGKIIGTVDCQLISRGEGFYYACDTISEEIQKCAVFFFDNQGRFQADHELRTTLSEGCNEGGFLYLNQVKINELQFRGKELGVKLIHKLLQRLAGKWSVCFVHPIPINALLEDPLFNDRTYNEKLVGYCQCYARIGFQQCSKNDASSQTAYWCLDATKYTGDNIMTKEESKLVQVVMEIQEQKLNEDNEKISEIIASFRNLNPTRCEIETCKTQIKVVLAGGLANLNTGHALHYAMANLGYALIIPLVELGKFILNTSSLLFH